MDARRWSVVVVTVLAVVVGLVAFLAGRGDDEPARTASATTTSLSDSTTTSPPFSQVPDTSVAGPDAPFWLGGLVAPAGEVVVAGSGGCCSLLPGPELAAYRPTSANLEPSAPVANWLRADGSCLDRAGAGRRGGSDLTDLRRS